MFFMYDMFKLCLKFQFSLCLFTEVVVVLVC